MRGEEARPRRTLPCRLAALPPRRLHSYSAKAGGLRGAPGAIGAGGGGSPAEKGSAFDDDDEDVAAIDVEGGRRGWGGRSAGDREQAEQRVRGAGGIEADGADRGPVL